MKLVFMVEEQSMAEFLKIVLPRMIGDVPFQVIPHQGKTDLEQSIPRKLKAWLEPGVKFIILRDQDSAECKQVKADLRELCKNGKRPNTLVRIVCRELEAWFIGELGAVARAFGASKVAALGDKKKYRGPDRIMSPSRVMQELIPGYGKVSGARAIAAEFQVEACRSPSFAQFKRGLDRVLAQR